MLTRPSAFKALITGSGLVLPLISTACSLLSHSLLPHSKPSQSAALAAVAVTAAGGTPAFILKVTLLPTRLSLTRQFSLALIQPCRHRSSISRTQRPSSPSASSPPLLPRMSLSLTGAPFFRYCSRCPYSPPPPSPPLITPLLSHSIGPIAVWPPTLAALSFLDVPLPPPVSAPAATSSSSSSSSGGGVYDHTGAILFPWQTAPVICDGPSLCVTSPSTSSKS
jgi:hypothetical protein